MANLSETTETCTVCGASCESEAPFAHLYRGGRRLAICSPACFELFEANPEMVPGTGRARALADSLHSGAAPGAPDSP
jgi:YHS domain-containing protein